MGYARKDVESKFVVRVKKRNGEVAFWKVRCYTKENTLIKYR